MTPRLLALLFVVWLPAVAASAGAAGPWGQAKTVEKAYGKQKVVYDVAVKTVAQLENVLDRRVTSPR